MKIIKLLLIYIIILIGVILGSVYFLNIYTNLSEEVEYKHSELSSLESKINKIKKENKKWKIYKSKFNDYLEKNKTVKRINTFKEFVYFQENLENFAYLNDLNLNYSFKGKKTKIMNKIYFLNLDLKLEYKNIYELIKLTEYLKKQNEIRLKEIDFKKNIFELKYEMIINDENGEL
jgi:hypothetical protein